jgi:hypothetical protein
MTVVVGGDGVGGDDDGDGATPSIGSGGGCAKAAVAYEHIPAATNKAAGPTVFHLMRPPRLKRSN